MKWDALQYDVGDSAVMYLTRDLDLIWGDNYYPINSLHGMYKVEGDIVVNYDNTKNMPYAELKEFIENNK